MSTVPSLIYFEYDEELFPTGRFTLFDFAILDTGSFNDFSRCRFNAFDIADTVKNGIEAIQESILYFVNISLIGCKVSYHEAYKGLHELKL